MKHYAEEIGLGRIRRLIVVRLPIEPEVHDDAHVYNKGIGIRAGSNVVKHSSV